jgi:sensor domain CHASE-containing protein
MSAELRSLAAVAALPAIAFLVVVHGTVLAGLFASRLIRRKSYRADRCRQNRKQNFRIIFHGAESRLRGSLALVKN